MALKKLAVLDREQEKIGTVKDTSKYGSYLIGKFCYQLGCVESEFLMQVGTDTCHCGFKKGHVHCKNCGGIALVG